MLNPEREEAEPTEVSVGALRGADYALAGVPPHLSRMLVQSRLRLEALPRAALKSEEAQT